MRSNIEKQVLVLFETVRDIPYGDIGSRNAWDVLTENRGTCSGKHSLLQLLLRLIGIKAKPMMCRATFNSLSCRLPEHLSSMLTSETIFDYHNFLKIYLDDWYIVDATFDMGLKKLGFIVNDTWNCKSDCRLAFQAEEIWEIEDFESSKKDAIARMSANDRNRRKQFLVDLNAWLNGFRQQEIS